MAQKVFGAGNGQSVDANGDILLQAVILTPAAAAATLSVKGNGTELLTLQAAANGSSVQASSISGGNQFSLMKIPAPVTIDVTGSGAKVTLVW